MDRAPSEQELIIYKKVLPTASVKKHNLQK